MLRSLLCIYLFIHATSATPADFRFNVVSKNVSPTVLNRTEHWIEKISIASSSVDIKVTLGDTDDARSLISDSEMTEIKPEGYRIKAHCAEGASPLIAIRGNPR